MAQPSTVERTTMTPTPRPEEFDWRAEYAYTAGVQAFIYGFPYIYNARLRHDWVRNKQDPDVVPYAAVNEFWHASRLMDSDLSCGRLPEHGFAVLLGMVGPERGAGHPVPPQWVIATSHSSSPRSPGQLRLRRSAHHRLGIG
jgi:hypothetical protein